MVEFKSGDIAGMTADDCADCKIREICIFTFITNDWENRDSFGFYIKYHTYAKCLEKKL